jgi:hypothetical protein
VREVNKSIYSVDLQPNTPYNATPIPANKMIAETHQIPIGSCKKYAANRSRPAVIKHDFCFLMFCSPF